MIIGEVVVLLSTHEVVNLQARCGAVWRVGLGLGKRGILIEWRREPRNKPMLVNLQTLCSAEWWDLVDEEVSSYEWMMITDEMIKWPRTCGGEGTLAPDYQLAQHILS